MEFLLEYWLSIGTATFLVGMILYGHYKGFLRLAVSMAALILTLMIVRVASPYVSDGLRQNTAIQDMIQQGVMKAAGIEAHPDVEVELPAEQRGLIEQMKLPEQIRTTLIENNNSEVYELLGVHAFADYVGAYLSTVVINLVSAVLLFVVVYIGLRLIVGGLDLLARLPILSGMNQIAGAILGALNGLLILWGLCLLISACSQTQWGMAVLSQIKQSTWLTFLYENNVFRWLIGGILNHLA